MFHDIQSGKQPYGSIQQENRRQIDRFALPKLRLNPNSGRGCKWGEPSNERVQQTATCGAVLMATRSAETNPQGPEISGVKNADPGITDSYPQSFEAADGDSSSCIAPAVPMVKSAGRGAENIVAAGEGSPSTVRRCFAFRPVAASKLLGKLVGASGFEPPASWSRTRR